MAVDDFGLPCHMSIPDNTERVLDPLRKDARIAPLVLLESSAAASVAAGPLTGLMLAFRF